MALGVFGDHLSGLHTPPGEYTETKIEALWGLLEQQDLRSNWSVHVDDSLRLDPHSPVRISASNLFASSGEPRMHGKH